MSKATRFRVPLMVLLLVAAGCSAYPPPRPTALTDFGPCATSLAPDPNAPVAFVAPDGSGNPVVSPDPIRANDRFEHDQSRSVMIQWLARPGDTLDVRMQTSGCVDGPYCSGFRCYAFTNRLETKVEKPCKYDVTLNGKTVDPVVIIQPCC
jgi:hypothetical protein